MTLNIAQGRSPGRSVPRRGAAGPARQEKSHHLLLKPVREIEHQLIKTVVRAQYAVAVNMQFRTGDPASRQPASIGTSGHCVPDDQSWRADFAQPRPKSETASLASRFLTVVQVALAHIVETRLEQRLGEAAGVEDEDAHHLLRFSNRRLAVQAFSSRCPRSASA